MMRLSSVFALGLIFGIVFAAAQSPAQAANAALSARIVADGAANVVEITTNRRPAFRAFTRADPPRVMVDFPDLDWRLDAPQPGRSMRLISGVRFGLSPEGAARLVVDLLRPAAIRAAYTRPGQPNSRFVLELEPTSEEAFAEKAQREAAETSAAAGPPAPRPRPKRHVIVAIDAGHGGRDAGASYGDLKEKDLVLDYALRLQAAIEARPGYRVFQTRTGDEFVRLRERVARARRAGADLMISIHADALEKGAAAGASVFTLSDQASSAEAAELVASHNRADAIGGVSLDAAESDVARVLVDFARRRTDDKSESLAAAVADSLTKKSEILRDRAVQSAGFRILKAPDVPSILVEIGFLSAAKDRARLTSPAGRDAVVAALADGVFDWVSRQGGDRYSAPRRAVDAGADGGRRAAETDRPKSE